jgi:hypothetical protein
MDRSMDRRHLPVDCSENWYTSYFNTSSYAAIVFYAFRSARCVVIAGILICDCQPQAAKPWPHGQKHGQEHGLANKQSICALKISISAS